MGRSGVTEGFFAKPPTDPDDEPLPESEDEPLYLTAEQLARKRVGTRLVVAVVGIFAGLILFAVWRNRDGEGTQPTAPNATASASASPAPTATAAPTQTGAASASAPPPASASAATDGSGGQGGTAATAPGEGGAGGDGASPDEGDGGGLPEVDDPLAEAKKLIGIGRYKEGIPYAEAATKKDPSNGDAWFWLGTGYESIGKNDEAREAFGKCAENDASPQFIGYCRGRAPKQ